MNLPQYIQRFFKNDTNAAAIMPTKSLVSKNNQKKKVFQSEKYISDWKKAINAASVAPYKKKDLVAIIEQITFDGHLRAQLQTRQNGTLAESFVLQNPIDPPTEKLLKVIVRTILDSLFWWASAIEIADISNYYVLPPAYIVPEEDSLSIDGNSLLPAKNYENLLVFANPEASQGLLSIAARYVLYKGFSLSDWSRHSELFGMPFLVLKTPVNDSVGLQSRHKALSEFGSNAYVILDPDEELTALDPKTSGNPYEIYLKMIQFCDEQISKCIVGQTGTSDTKSFVGSAEVQERILDWYIEADMLYVSEIMNEKVLPFLANKGLVAQNERFEWLYFQQKKAEKKPEETKQQYKHQPCQHEGTYESYLLSLKKKALTFLNEQVFNFDFEDFWEKQDDSLFNYYLNDFQKPIEDLLSDTAYPKLQAQFLQNAYEFALAKTATFLANSEGLSKAEAKSIFAKMERYTETEKTQFALAIQAAEEWQEILKDKDLFPNLEYRAVGDENTRESHQQLSGIIKPIEDAFWGKYYPPIDYRCRCSVRQHQADAKITKNLPEKLPKVAKGLDHNPGQTGQAFNFSHPYFENASKKALANVAEYSQYDKAYRKEYFDVKTGGYLVAHKQADKKDLKENLMVGRILAENDYAVEIQKHIQKDDAKNPELVVNKEISDLKTPDLSKYKSLASGIKGRMKSGDSQKIKFTVIYIEDTKADLEKDMMYGIRNGFTHSKQEKVIIVWKGKTCEITRRMYEDGAVLDTLKSVYEK
ncbi:MAG: DUF935 family protein [Thermonemataceae bacterium]|nr:DUF935 family protein [Thermonemataceae bacterium]